MNKVEKTSRQSEEPIVTEWDTLVNSIKFPEEAINEETEIERNYPTERIKFAGFELPASRLGLDKILLEEVKHRPENDIASRQHDEKVLASLLSPPRGINISKYESKIAKELTPEVAGLFLDSYNGILCYEPLAQRILEALPLDYQEQYFVEGYIDGAMLEFEQMIDLNSSGKDQGVSESILTKSMLSIIQMGVGKAKLSRIDKLIKTLSKYNYFSRSNIDEDERKYIYDNMLNAIISKSNEKYSIEEAKKYISKEKILLATTILSTNYIREHLEEIIDQDYVEDGLDMNDMVLIQRSFYPGGDVSDVSEEQKEQYDSLFPDSMRELANIIAEPSSLYDIGRKHDEIFLDKLAGIYRDEATIVTDFLNSSTNIIDSINIETNPALDKRFPWARMIICEDENTLKTIYQIKQRWPIEKKLVKNVGRYLSDCYSSQAWGRGSYLHLAHLEDIEQLKDFDMFLASIIKQELIDGEMQKARKHIFEYTFGASQVEIGRNLVSLGICELKEQDNRDPESFFARKGIRKPDIENFKISDLYLSQLRETNGFSDDDITLILEAVDLMCCPDEYLHDKFVIYLANHDKDSIRLGAILQKLKDENVRETSIAYSNYMQQCIKKGTFSIGNIEFRDERIPLLEMQSDEFMFLVHRLGAYLGKDLDHPSSWNTGKPKKAFYHDGSPIGYISTCAITDCAINLAGIDDVCAINPEEIFYAFTDFGKDTLKYMAAYDLFTKDGLDDKGRPGIVSERQDYLYRNPRNLADATRDNTYGYNEVVLDRYSGNPNEHGGRLQPNYLIVFTNDPNSISERVKKHAAYFHVPIMMIDPQKYT